MKLQPILQSKPLQFLALGLLLSVIGIILTINQPKVSSQQFFPEPTATPRFYIEATGEVTAELIELYSPSHFGIPDSIGGYPVLAVFTSANTECMPDGEIRIQFQIPATTPEEYFQGNTAATIIEAVDKLGLPDITIMVAGPGSDLETIIRENERWNAGIRASGCIQFGGPIEVILTATPSAGDVQLSKYTPSFFRLPATVAGYELLAVLDEESVSTNCYIFGVMHLLVRAKGAVDEEYFSGNASLIRQELEQKFGLQVVIEFVDRDTTEADIIQIIDGQIQRMKAKGCYAVRLGPIPDSQFATPEGDNQ